jgi:hypothetical protein
MLLLLSQANIWLPVQIGGNMIVCIGSGAYPLEIAIALCRRRQNCSYFPLPTPNSVVSRRNS